MSMSIDQSRKFKVDPAGPCERCGFFKTWEFRVLNEKTGRMMPGHVTADGYKIGDGKCPYWEAFSKEKKAIEHPVAVPAQLGIGPVVPATPAQTSTPAPAPSFQTAEAIFNLSPADRAMTENLKRAIVQTLTDDLREVIAVLREIRDGRSRAQLNADAAGAGVQARVPDRPSAR